MSQWIRNKSCEICGRIEVGLVEMNVGKLSIIYVIRVWQISHQTFLIMQE